MTEIPNRIMRNFEPAIKWSGSKRSQAYDIISYFPTEIDTYYEPFCGGASILRALLEDKESHRVKHYVCSDLNNDLIETWKMIKEQPSHIADAYEERWNELNKDDDKERKKQYFAEARKRLNETHQPEDFLFIMRTTTNGMPRYNSKGEFNNSFHVTRDGIQPDTLRKVMEEWSTLLRANNVDFKRCSYEMVQPTSPNDFVYLDPPYANTKGMYYGSIDNDKLFDYLRNLKCPYAMSFDGKSGEEDNTFPVPEDVFSEHHYMLSGNSSFKRTIGKDNNAIVYESLYLK